MTDLAEKRPGRRRSHLIGALAAACLALAVLAPGASAFGIASFTTEFKADQAGAVATQAGSHPYFAGSRLAFQTEVKEFETVPGQIEKRRVALGDVKDIDVELPAGLVGDPSATPKCEPAQAVAEECPPETQIGMGGAVIGEHNYEYPLYNVTPPPGVPAQFGFKVVGLVPIIVTASVRPAKPGSTEGYGIDLHIHSISQGQSIEGASLGFFGTPPGSSGQKPFVTMPTHCGGNLELRAHVTSWQGDSDTASTLVEDPAGNPVTVDDCDRVPFDPKVTTGLDVGSTDSPSGLSVGIATPQQTSPTGIASANLRAATVTLPAGVSINPSAANGLTGCSVAQFGQFGEAPSTCPDAAKIGTVQIDTPLLPDPIAGGIYLARQTENPFGSLVALYLVGEADGVRVKLPGKIAPDPTTGQLTATFEETPQLPFDSVALHFFDGPGAALATPVVCGSGGVSAALTPWTGAAAATPPASLTVKSGTGGSPCPANPGARPFGLGFEAGTVSPAASLHSPFDLEVTRPDGAQELGRIDATLPKGLLATLRGVPECEAANAASGTCGPASQVGSVVVGAGAGASPFYVKTGRAYLTGPYGGAPLGLDFVVPAVAGPLDLGNVNVRAALFVDPETAQVTVKSDPLPKILDGIPLRLRSVDVGIDRPGFVVNPTSCDPTSVTGQVTSTEGAIANLSDRFQAAGCRGLAFAPKLATRLIGGRKALRRGGHPKLRVTLSQRPGGANLSAVSVTLPRSILLDQGHIKTVCTRVQFAASQCPKGSVYGRAEVKTPLLGEPLRGPVYLRSSSHTLPDLVFDLRGQIRIVLDGRIDSHKGGIRVSFGQIPDAAVSKFVLNMKGGGKGLLQGSVDLCKKKGRSIVKTDGQNGAVKDGRPVLSGSCGKRRK